MKFVKKSDSMFMKFLGLFLGRRFRQYFWTTLGTTVYVPSRHDGDRDWGTELWVRRNRKVIEHEKVHVEQFRKYGWLLMILLYIGPAPFFLMLIPLFPPLFIVLTLLTIPLSTTLAWGRWFIEREAFLTQIHNESGAKWAADLLWNDYFFTWPPLWSENWFMDRIERQ